MLIILFYNNKRLIYQPKNKHHRTLLSKMASIIITKLEKILLVLTGFILFSSIILALCIPLVLPYHWTAAGYVPKDAIKSQELNEYCKCGQRQFSSRSLIDCILRVFSERVILGATEQASSVCEMIQNYPYVVSLNAPAYSDDKNERRYACAGIILSTTWILVGEDCVQYPDELKELRVRAGSSYWSKGGTEYDVLATSAFSEKGPRALKVDRPFVFNAFVSAIKVSKERYSTWDSAVSIGWSKFNDRKYSKFIVQRWTTIQCPPGDCSTGEVRREAISVCQNQKFGNTLVTDTKLLVGIQNEICYDNYNMSRYIFTDVQTTKYRKWFRFLTGDLGEEEGSNKQIESKIKPLQIYEVKEYVTLDSNSTEIFKINKNTLEVAKSEYNIPAADIIMEKDSADTVRKELTDDETSDTLKTSKVTLSPTIFWSIDEQLAVQTTTTVLRPKNHRLQSSPNFQSSTGIFNLLTSKKKESTEPDNMEQSTPSLRVAISSSYPAKEFGENENKDETDESINDNDDSEYDEETFMVKL